MDYIKEKLITAGRAQADRFKMLSKEHGDKVVQKVTLGQVFSGMRGVVSLLTCTSKLDPDESGFFQPE